MKKVYCGDCKFSPSEFTEDWWEGACYKGGFSWEVLRRTAWGVEKAKVWEDIMMDKNVHNNCPDYKPVFWRRIFPRRER